MNNLYINKKRHLRMSPKRSVEPGSSEGVGASNCKRLIVSRDQQSYSTPKVKYLNFGNERRVTAPSRVSAPIDAKHKPTEQLITNVKGVDCSEKNSRRKLETRPPKHITNAVLVRKGPDGFSHEIHFNSQNGQVSSPEPCQDSRPSQLQKEMSYLQQTIIGHDSARPVSSKINHVEVECFNPPPSCDVGQTVKLENEIIKPDYIDYNIAEAVDETSEQILGSDRRVIAPSKVLAPVDAKRKLEQLITNVKEVDCSKKNSRRKVWPPKPFTNPVLARTGLGTDGVSQEIHFNRHVSSFGSCQVSRPSKLLKERSYLQQTSGRDSARPERSKINHAKVRCFDQPPSCDVGLAVKLRANPALPHTTSDSQGLENEIIKPDYLDYNIAEAEISEQNYVGDKSPLEDPSHDKVRNLLGLYKDTVERLQHENKMRPRGQRYMGIAINVKAAMQLKKENKWLNVSTCVGHVPGVEVGDQFQSRAELVIVGLHSKFMAGIDYYKYVNGKIYATAIIASGRYIGDRNDNADVLIYVGEGGNPQDKFSKANDQQLVRGNLALKNTIDKRPVRVIRSIEEPKSKDASSVKRSRYVYDGLYLVKKCWSEHDPSGNLIFKFQLNKIHKQPQLARTTHDMVRKSSKTSYGYIVIADISEGKESIPIHVVNEYDLQKPPHFKYMTMMIWSQLCTISMPFSCDCNNQCSEDMPCSCIIKTKTEGSASNSVSIVEEKPIIYECGTSCKCPPECKYRLSQHGIKLQLEVFRDGSTGWGVRSRNYISAGRFICEYVGELLQYKQEDGRIDFSSSTTRNSYGISDHDTNNETYGNVGRFIRYHCSPNLYAKCVLFDHEDRRRPHVMLFAAKNIPPLKELTFDYKLWGQEGQNQKDK